MKSLRFEQSDSVVNALIQGIHRFQIINEFPILIGNIVTIPQNDNFHTIDVYK